MTPIVRKERRGKLEIYYDILNAIQMEGNYQEGAKPTRVQYRSNMSYDKLTRYLIELENKSMITKAETLFLTDKSRKFLKEYAVIKDFTDRMGLDYLS